MIYLSADLHISHHTNEQRNIINYCNRPFKDVDEMNSTIKQNWNNIITNEDIVYLLGDYLFKRNIPEDWHLNGHIILIRGNHDRGVSEAQFKEKYCISEVYKTPITISYKDYELFLMHAPRQLHKNKINLCAHVHDAWLYKDGFYNVGCDVHDFKPVLLDSIIEYLKENCLSVFQ